jgi:hypothetical protein
MNTQLQPGQQVTVSAFGGKRPSVIVVEDRGNVVMICKPAEFERAQAEKRAPLAVGFHREDVIVPTTEAAPRKGVASETPTNLRGSQAGD